MSYVPSAARTVPSAEALSGFNEFTREKVLERVMDPLIFLPAATVASFAGVAAGAPVVQELGTSGLVSIFMADADDAFSVLWPIPPQADMTKQIDFRIFWSQSQGAGTGSCLWTMKYRPIFNGVTAITAPCATALDDPIAVQVDKGADIGQWSAWGSIDENKADVMDLVSGDDFLQLDLISDTQTTITDADLIQAQVRYYRKLL